MHIILYCGVPPKSLIIRVKAKRPLLSNVYNQNAYFSGNGVRLSLVAAVLKAFLIQHTYETLKEDVFYTVRLSVIREQTNKFS
jgi:hypothetical protein